MTSRKNGTLYTGVTSDLVRRVHEHRTGLRGGFTARYGCKRLAWYELQGSIESAILREKQIKGGSRADKLMLSEESNPEWRDLWCEIVGSAEPASG